MIDEVNALLNSSPSMDITKWKVRIDQLVPSRKKLNPSLETPLQLEFKSSTKTFEYVFWGDENTLPVIISSALDGKQKSKLLSVSKNHKEALRWTIANIKGINPVDYMHYVHLDKNAKSTKEMQSLLNLNMKEVIGAEVLKALDIGIHF